MKYIAATFYILVLASCSTGYHQLNNLSGGYDSFQLSKDTFQVRFIGNEFTSENQVYKFALRRAAELSKQHGYRYFKVIYSSQDSTTRIYSTPLTHNRQTNKHTYHDAAFLHQAQAEEAGAACGNQVQADKPAISLEIKMYKHPQKDAFDAVLILQNFKKTTPYMTKD